MCWLSTQSFMSKLLVTSQASTAGDGGASGMAEGVVLRTADRSVTAKARFKATTAP